MKKIEFNEDIGSLVDQEGNQYEGKRLCTIQAYSFVGSASKVSAKSETFGRLMNMAEEKKADAYEIMSTNIYDSHQEYDSLPYTCSITSILYKTQ